MMSPDYSKSAPSDVEQIAAYSKAQPFPLRSMCALLHELIKATLPKATSRIWHGSPVWFLEDNPVVGYEATSKGVKLLFWNGQAFQEAELMAVGKYRAAQAVFNAVEEIDPELVRRWLKKARSDIFDSRGFFRGLRRAH